jgi:hypothetical protein
VAAPAIVLSRVFQLPAKIAHAYATAELGHGNFQPFLVDYILEKRPEKTPYDLIGGTAAKEISGDYDLELDVIEHEGQRLITVEIQLLPELMMPRYRVVAGRLNPGRAGEPRVGGQQE